MAVPTLDEIIMDLFRRAIDCGLQTLCDGGIRIWIGDETDGHKAETVFDHERMADAAQWLYDTARHLHPEAF